MNQEQLRKVTEKHLAKISEDVNGEEHSFHKWVKSDIIYNHMNQDYTNIHNTHNTLMDQLYEQAMEGSGFTFLRIGIVIIENYKINDIQAFSCIEVPI